jgi:Transcriptional regulatory protein, C terminal/PAS fold
VPRPVSGLSSAERAALLERVPDIVWRYRLAPTPTLEYVSSSISAVTGYTPQELYDDPDLSGRLIHPDHVPLLAALLVEPQNQATVVLRWRHRSGTVLTTEQRITMVRDEAGRPVALEGIGRPLTEATPHLVRAGDVVLDLGAHRVLVDRRVVDLTPAEHRILALLVDSDGPVAIESIVQRLWGHPDAAGVRVVQVHISNLRRKIEVDPHAPQRLVTRRGLGYELSRD